MPEVLPVPDLLAAATQRLVRTTDGLEEEELRAASLLPGWSRAHVLAHLALNAEGLEGVLTGLRRGRAEPMYRSPEARDADIEDLAREPLATLRERLLAACHCFERALEPLSSGDLVGEFERTPGGPTLPLGQVPLMRWREVQIHHADLGLEYTHHDWSDAFSIALLESMTHRDHAEPFTVLARDLARSWRYGDPDGGGPHVTGRAADLGWWLAGRGDGTGVTSDGGLPTISAW